MLRRGAYLPLLLVAALLAGCGELQDWRSTQRADTLEAYEAFIESHPQSQYVPVAQRRLADLLEQRDWLIATESDTAEGYRAFINNHPKGRWTREARVRLQNFLSTPGVIGPAAIEPYESAPPPAMLPAEPEAPAVEVQSDAAPRVDAAPPADAAPRADAASPVSHRIQLGAYSSRDIALEAWRTARTKHVELQGLVSQVVAGRNARGEVFRLQASVASEERAREVCRVLVAGGQGCVYVPPGR
ncbi:MAG: SPOR domain-containing protein [Gammaproteobacteria bacterium]|nr:SPOR domain-containing protein [Gammaproteobacteria bacterium]